MSRKQILTWLFAPLFAVWAACVGLLVARASGLDATLSSQCAAELRDGFPLSLAFAAALASGFGILAIGLYMHMRQPIHALAMRASALRAGDFRTRLGWKRRDDIGRLALAMDTLCDQLEAVRYASETHIDALEQLRHSDRIATLGRLASSVAHELGNPLNVVEMRAQLIAAGDITTLEGARQSASIIIVQTRRMTAIISEILSFARRQPARVALLDLLHVVRNAIALSEHAARKRGLTIRFEPHEASIEVAGDADKLLQIVVNLLLNSIQATARGGVVRVFVRNALRSPVHDPEAPEEPYACVDVVDHGVGIPVEMLSKVFEPFISSKPPGEGTGLGLSVAQGIAKEHDGWIDVESALGRGSHFTVYLPRGGKKDVDHDWQTALH